jgi:E3 ubiquitin-protein ligase BIG BROTHER-like protein
MEAFEDDSVDPDEMTYEELTALGEAVGTVSKGLPAAAVAALPRCAFSELAAKGHAPRGDAERCCICCCDFEAEEGVALLPACAHVYHAPCIATWLSGNKVCPVCSTEVSAAPPPAP